LVFILLNIIPKDFYDGVIKDLEVQEKSSYFDPNILKLGRDVYLEGYWANEKYFKDIESTIRQEFTVKYPLVDDNKQLVDEIKNCNSVSLHVRRGDYLRYAGYIVPLDYYYEAVKKVVEQFSDIHIFFSPMIRIGCNRILNLIYQQP
jgi:hypothetical protein